MKGRVREASRVSQELSGSERQQDCPGRKHQRQGFVSHLKVIGLSKGAYRAVLVPSS